MLFIGNQKDTNIYDNAGDSINWKVTEHSPSNFYAIISARSLPLVLMRSPGFQFLRKYPGFFKRKSNLSSYGYVVNKTLTLDNFILWVVQCGKEMYKNCVMQVQSCHFDYLNGLFFWHSRFRRHGDILASRLLDTWSQGFSLKGSFTRFTYPAGMCVRKFTQWRRRRQWQ